jgi:hypothetical protein
MNEIEEGNQTTINIIKNGNVNLLADSQSILNGWKHYFNKLNVHGFHDNRQMDIYTAAPLVPC